MHLFSTSIHRFATVCGLAILFAGPAQAHDPEPAAPAPHRVLLVVWDGLRPDTVNDENTPTLAALARDGVFFARHHSVYPTMTEVNGTALATGCYPAHSGLIGNREYRPAIDPLKTVAMENLATVRRGDEVSDGHYLSVATLPELMHSAGMRTAVAGTKPVVTLADRAARPDGENPEQGWGAGSVTLFEGKTLPTNLATALADKVGRPFPTEIHFPNVAQDEWTVDALIGALWPREPEGSPRLTVLWMSDPDYTQHQFGPDTLPAKRALASVDSKLAAVLAALELKGLRATTDVLVVSDHGFSTIGRGVDLGQALRDAGFHAGREYMTSPQPGDILVNGLGGSVFLYVAGHDAGTIRRVVDFLQGSDFAGVIFTRDRLPGTFGLAVGHIDSPDAPDIAVALRWSEDRATTGLQGTVVSDGARKPGQGTHGTLSRFDLHNTLIANGPGFRRGWRDESPSGNTDITPTIAHLLGLTTLPKMDGRVLAEALGTPPVGTDLSPPKPERIETRNDAGQKRWMQYLLITRFGGVDYFDEGNGSSGPAPQS